MHSVSWTTPQKSIGEFLTFCWPSAVDSARRAVDTADFAMTGRWQARQSDEPVLLAATRRDAIVNGVR